MTEAERIAAAKADAEAKARADAEAGEKLDKLLTGIDSIHKRLDATDKRMDEYCAKVDSMHKDDDDDDDDGDDDEKKFADAVKRGDAKKKGPLEGFMEGGEFHPIRASAGYSKRKTTDSEEEYAERHDAEEASEREALEGAGVAREVAADKAKRHRKDAEEKEAMIADKKRKDAEEEERKNDARRRRDAEDTGNRPSTVNDAELTQLRADLIELRARMPLDSAHPDYTKLLDAQAKADDVFRAFGDSAPRPLNGEALLAYRMRIAGKLQTHSPKWKPVELNKLAEPAFAVAEEQIYTDSMEVARNPATVADGDLRIVPGKTAAGHVMNTFVGHPSAWMNAFGGQRRAVVDIVTKH